jgi:hypothetical protein
MDGRSTPASPNAGVLFTVEDVANLVAMASRDAAAAAASEAVRALQGMYESRRGSGVEPGGRRADNYVEKVSLPRFSGKDNVVIWLNKMENILGMHGELDLDAVKRATMQLDDSAWAWFDSLRKEYSTGYPFIGWSDFRDQLIREFRPRNENMVIRRRLHQMRQTGSVEEYTRKFRELVVQIDDMSAADQIHFYCSGLKQLQQQKSSTNSPRRCKMRYWSLRRTTIRTLVGRVVDSICLGRDDRIMRPDRRCLWNLGLRRARKTSCVSSAEERVTSSAIAGMQARTPDKGSHSSRANPWR